MLESRRRILLVDDEEFVRSAIRRALRREPYEIEEAADAGQALELLSRSRFDLILADHLMPGMKGLELLSIARDRWPDTIRVILTGHADTAMAIDAINHGEIYRFLTKPWDDLQLRITLFNAFERLDAERERRRLLAEARQLRLAGLAAPSTAGGAAAGAAAEPIPEEAIRAVLGGRGANRC